MKKYRSILILLAAWQLISLRAELVPSPLQVATAMGGILGNGVHRADILHTLLRGMAGLALASLMALLLGILCGLNQTARDMVSSIVTFCQGCPPIVWLSLLMIWLGSGTAVPVVVVFASTFPVLFINICHGTASLDRRYFAMARLYRVPLGYQLTRLILPGISTSLKSAYSFAVGITWKVASTAEYFGSETGIGARIQQCFQRIDMPELFAWALLLALLGLFLDTQKRLIV